MIRRNFLEKVGLALAGLAGIEETGKVKEPDITVRMEFPKDLAKTITELVRKTVQEELDAFWNKPFTSYSTCSGTMSPLNHNITILDDSTS